MEGREEMTFVDDDMFECLSQFRNCIEPEGYRVLCFGSKKNAYPSGMGRDMGCGYGLYELYLGKSAESPLVKIFDYCEEDIVTVKEQRAFFEQWKDSNASDGYVTKRRGGFLRDVLWLWLGISAVRVGTAVVVLNLQAKRQLSYEHLPLVFFLWPEVFIFPIDEEMYLIDYALLLSLALCVGSAFVAVTIAGMMHLARRLTSS